MNNLAEKLLKMKEEIEEAQQEKSKLEGRLQQLLHQLKKEFGCNDIKEAEEQLNSLKKEIEIMEQELEKGIQELENEDT